MRPSSERHVLAKLREVLAPRENTPPMEQWRFAKVADCSVETIRKIEKGKIKLSEALAYKISVNTGVSFEWLRANDRSAPPVDGFGRPYSRKTFENTRAEKWLIEPTLMSHVGIVYFARIQAMSSAAFKADFKSYRVAMYKLNTALKELEEEYGFDKTVYDLESADIRKAIELAKKDVLEMEAIFAPKIFGPPPLSKSTRIEMRDGSVVENYDFDPKTNRPRKRRIIRPLRSSASPSAPSASVPRANKYPK